MAVNNPFTITYNGTAIGGSSDSYQLNGPYVIDKSYRTFRLSFEVLVVASSAATLRSLSDTLETKFRERDKDLEINVGATAWTWTSGTHYFNVGSAIAKSGDSETDRGFSRAYTVVITAELPSDASGANGLLEIRTNVSFEASRQKHVTVEGIYTATTGNNSEENYQANADAYVDNLLAAIDGGATWELVAEDYDFDRNTANTHFQRQYVEILFDQSQGALDDPSIRDHRVIFTDLSQHPADSREGVQRLRRVVGSYDCALDVEQATDLQDAFDSLVRPHVIQTFRDNFSPVVFCLEDRRISYDETTKRMSVSLQFLYQKDGGEAVVEVTQSVAFRELRNIDYTPIHSRESESAFYADPGWSTIERVWTRTVVVLGDERPQRRISGSPQYGDAGDFGTIAGQNIEGGRQINLSGWNIISNVSQVQEQWIGDPTNDDQMKLTALTETVVERWNDLPGRGTASGGPITPGAG